MAILLQTTHRHIGVPRSYPTAAFFFDQSTGTSRIGHCRTEDERIVFGHYKAWMVRDK